MTVARPFVQGLRYVAAIVVSSCIAPIAGIPFAFAIDVLWGRNVTAGRWPLTFPNVLLAVIEALICGFIAGWIAGRRGKLIAATSDFSLLLALITWSLIINRDIIANIHMDTQPSLWVWVGLVPAMLGGHFAVKWKPNGMVPLVMGLGATMGIVAQLGAVAFHFYTVFVAYEIRGIGSALIALIFPVISELWWTWWIWGIAHAFWNAYSLRFALLISWWAVAVVLSLWAGYVHESRKEKQATIGAA